MKNLKYIALSGLAVLLAASSLTSCTDGNDWGVDESHARLFRASKVSASPAATDATITWTGTPGTEYYIIEVSKDSLYDAIEMGASASSLVYGKDQSIHKSPVTLAGLDSSSKYFLRMKSFSSSTAESNWSYVIDYSFKTKAEQIMESVGPADKTATTVTLRWTPNTQVTRIDLLTGSTVTKTVTLTGNATALSEGTITIDGLSPLTNYTANIYNNDVKRGFASFQTYPQVPTADKIVYMEATDALDQALFDGLSEAGYQTVSFAMPANAVYKNADKIIVPNGMSVTFFGLPGANKPIIAIQVLELSASHTYIKFENVEVSANSIDAKGAAKINQYFFNQSNATAVGTIEFNNCIIRDFAYTPMRLQGAAVKVISNFNVINSIVYGSTTRNYSLVHVDATNAAGKINNILFENSTVKYTGKSFIYSNNTNMESIIVRNCTFSQAPNAADYFIDFTTAAKASNGVTIQNVILGSIQGGATTKGIRGQAGMTITVTNSYNTLDWVTNGSNISNLTPYEGRETALFQDPSNNDFTIKDNSFPGKRSCGDPRWYMPE